MIFLSIFWQKGGEILGRDKKLLDATKKHLTKEEKEKKMKEEEVLYNYTPLDFSKVPKWLNKTAKKEWKRIGIYLTELPISELDRKSVELYCYYVALIEEAGNQLNEEPIIVFDKRNPLIDTINGASKELKTLTNSLGLTINARMKIANPSEIEPPKVDPFAEMFRRVEENVG